MSAIAGLFEAARSVDRSAIEGMLDALAHWTTDARATWLSGQTALGHLLLRTTPQSAYESLPFHDAARDVAITADARLDNRDDLARALGISAAELPQWPDGRLILHAYYRWRLDCPSYLKGDFAFAIADGSRRELFCARDKFGVRPFYYAESGGTFACATQIRSLLTLPWVDRRPNEIWIAEYLHRLGSDRAATIYRGVRRLEPARALLVSAGGMRQWRYWQLDPTRELPPARDEDYDAMFSDALTRAIQRRLESPRPVGAELSGGLDSSAICALAQRALAASGRSLVTFSQVRPPGLPDARGRPPDTRWAIDALLQHAGIDDALFFPGEGGVLEALDWATNHGDEPAWSFICLDNRSLLDAARERGIGVMLSGFGGNLAVSAPAREVTSELLRSGHWIELWRELCSSRRHPLLRLGVLLLRQFDGPLLAPLRLPGFRRWHHWVVHPYRPTRDAFAARMRMWRRTRDYSRIAQPRGTLRGRAIRSLETSISRRLDEEARWAGARGFEYRYPMLDEDLVALWLALPSRMKHRRGRGRYAMGRALKGLVPQEILDWRGPAGSGNPGALTRKQRDEEELRRRLLVLPASHPVFEYVDLPKLFAPPPLPGRVPRERHTEMMQVLMLASWLDARLQKLV